MRRGGWRGIVWRRGDEGRAERSRALWLVQRQVWTVVLRSPFPFSATRSGNRCLLRVDAQSQAEPASRCRHEPRWPFLLVNLLHPLLNQSAQTVECIYPDMVVLSRDGQEDARALREDDELLEARLFDERDGLSGFVVPVAGGRGGRGGIGSSEPVEEPRTDRAVAGPVKREEVEAEGCSYQEVLAVKHGAAERQAVPVQIEGRR